MSCRPTLQFPQQRLIELLHNIQRFVLHLLVIVTVFLFVELSNTVGHAVCGIHRFAHVNLSTLVHDNYDVGLGGSFAGSTGLFLTLRRRLP